MTDTLGILNRTVAPTIEPVSLEELHAHLRVVNPADDLLVWHYAQRARAALEDAYRLAFLTQTWTWKLDQLPDESCLYVPWLPLVSVSSITYLDDAGSTQTWSSSNYQVQGSYRRRGRIMPAYNSNWPDVRSQTFGAITVTFVAGWTSAALVPPPLKQAVLMYAAHLYAHRGDTDAEFPATVMSLMNAYGLDLYV